MAELARVFGRIGCLSFGGPAAQIGLMHRELVEQRAWLTEDEFLRALSFCMLLPGPEAMQLAAYAGWRLRGVTGGLAAGLLFVAPGATIVGLLAAVYLSFGDLPAMQAALSWVQAAVVAIVVLSLASLSRRALRRPDHAVIAALAFAALFLFSAPFPGVIVLAAALGALRAPSVPDPAPRTTAVLARSARIVAIGLAVWFAPVALTAVLGAGFLTTLGLFFAKLAVVTFGGAYAVLAYMTQEVVLTHGWVTTPQMIDALGLAETTPGPLILVTQFVGHLAGAAQGGPALAILAGLLALWMTFVPCFIWIFAGAPLIDWLDGRPRIAAALSAVTAAVLGVIANLALWFATHVFFVAVGEVSLGPVTVILPDFAGLRPDLVAVAIGFGLLIRWRPSLLVPALVATAGLGAFSGGPSL